MIIPDVLAAFVRMLEPLDVEIYGYFPDAPNVPCLIVFFEEVPFDLTDDATYVIRIVGGTTEMQGAQNAVFQLMTDIVDLIDADNTLGGAVSSVLPDRMRDWGIAPTAEGRVRYLQADIVCNVLTQ